MVASRGLAPLLGPDRPVVPCANGSMVRGWAQIWIPRLRCPVGWQPESRAPAPIYQQVQDARSLRNVGRCLQVFIADGYDKDAFTLARSEGVIPATPESLFGEEVARSLGLLTELLQDVYPKADNLEKLDTVFSRLSRIEGVAVNLRGALFEYLAAELVRCTSTYTDIRMNEIFRDETGVRRK